MIPTSCCCAFIPSMRFRWSDESWDIQRWCVIARCPMYVYDVLLVQIVVCSCGNVKCCMIISYVLPSTARAIKDGLR